MDLANETLERAGSQSRSVASIVVDELRKDILHNRLKGGDRVRQDAVAVKHGVSQMIVREAFKQLTAEGFLKAEPRRGVSVALLHVNEAWEVTQLRALLECQALRWAIPHMMRSDFVRGRQILDELDESETVDAKILLNAKFHSNLYAPAASPKTLEIIDNLRLNFERYLRYTWEETHHLEQSQAEHRQIIHICELREVDRACDMLRKHILSTGDLLTESLQRDRRG